MIKPACVSTSSRSQTGDEIGCVDGKALYLRAEKAFETAQMPLADELVRVGAWRESGGIMFSMVDQSYRIMNPGLQWKLRFYKTGVDEFLSDSPALSVVNEFWSSTARAVYSDGNSICWFNDVEQVVDKQCRMQQNGKLLCLERIPEMLNAPRSIVYLEYSR